MKPIRSGPTGFSWFQRKQYVGVTVSVYVSLIETSLNRNSPHFETRLRQVWSAAGPSPSWPVLMVAPSSPSPSRLWSLSWCPKSHTPITSPGWSVSTAVGSAPHRVCLRRRFCCILGIFVDDLGQFFFRNTGAPGVDAFQWLASSLTAPEPLNSSTKTKDTCHTCEKED